jgi:Zn-dependent M28 family amino/carboxypeptidase
VRKRMRWSVFSLMLAVLAAKALSLADHFDGKTWWNHVKVLADDNMDGRETGSEGLRKAEAYITDQLQKAGLQPAAGKAGTRTSFYQPVNFESRQIVESDSSIVLVRDDKVEPLTLGEDALLNTRVDLAPKVVGSLVFVGYGLSIPENNYDDLAGLDLKDKVAVYITGSPAETPPPLASHYQSSAERWKALRKAGAIGAITIPNPAAMDIPWSRMALSRTRPSMELVDPQFNETAGEKLSIIFNPAKAEILFASSRHSFQEIADLAKDRKPLPRFPLLLSIKTKASVVKKSVESANVIAKLPGSDPQLRGEYVVLSAHIDHLGIGEPINGDRIYNGAMDNGSGSALVLDIAASLKNSPDKIKRSVLFVWVTGEEKGLLGSKYFTANPTVDPKSMVANINVDMFLPIVRLKLLTIYGLAESDLGDMARQVAETEGVEVQADPEPLRNIFIRSDQYNFIRHGIPALALGIAPTSAEEKQLFKDWLTQRYHAPSDDLNQPVDLAAAAKYEDIVRALTIKVANDSQRPRWKADSFFRRYAEAAGE